MSTVIPATDLDLTAKEITELATPDAITAFLAKLGYDTSTKRFFGFLFLTMTPYGPARVFP